MINSTKDFQLQRPEDNVATLREKRRYLETLLGFAFPERYLRFLYRHYGTRDFLGKRSLDLYTLDEIYKQNIESVNMKNFPRLVAFGANGVGGFYAFVRNLGETVVECDWISDEVDSTVCSANFEGFLDWLQEPNYDRTLAELLE